MSKTLTFTLMDAPYENSRTVTALRLLDIAARRGYHLKVFAYEGAVGLAFKEQKAHPNAVHGHDVEEENHPLPHLWIEALHKTAIDNGGSLDWVNCGLCVDERGVSNAIDCARRGTPADFWGFVTESDNTLVIPTS